MAHCNEVYVKCNKHAYNILPNVNENMKNLLNDEKVLCLDGTKHDNVNRFLNHQCHDANLLDLHDANLLDLPIQIGTNAKKLYHVRC
jgi:hypothetical protein